MPADGLTKALPRQRHETFVQQLGLVDIAEHLKKLDNHQDSGWGGVSAELGYVGEFGETKHMKHFAQQTAIVAGDEWTR